MTDAERAWEEFRRGQQKYRPGLAPLVWSWMKQSFLAGYEACQRSYMGCNHEWDEDGNCERIKE